MMNEKEIEKWNKTLFREEISEKSGLDGDKYPCHFSEFDKYGSNQPCWFNPSPTTCQLCLLGQIAEQIGFLSLEIKDVKKILEKILKKV